MAETGNRYELHPMCLLFPKLKPEERAQRKENMVQRQQKGLSPLEHPILLLCGKILDGRHRYEIWLELAAENACDGYFANNDPPTDNATAESEADGSVLLRIVSLQFLHRSIPADQKAAIWMKLVDSTPALREKYEALEVENQKRMKAGKPSDKSGKGSSTVEALASEATVSATVMKTVKQVKREASPESFADLVEGKTTASAILKKLADNKKGTPSKPKPLALAKVGDKVFTVNTYEFGDGDVYLKEQIVNRIDGDYFHFESGDKSHRNALYDRNGAVKQRLIVLVDELKAINEEVRMLRNSAKKSAEVIPLPTQPTSSPKVSSQLEAKQTV